MKQIEQTILSIEDIAEHREFLRNEQQFSSRLSADWKQAVIDDMLVRFAMTFFESEVIG